MATLVDTVVEKIYARLQDVYPDPTVTPQPVPIRWTLKRVLKSMSAAQRQIALQDKSATANNVSFPLAPGCLQTVPTDGQQFLKLMHNLGLDGKTPGAPITFVDMENLGREVPTWLTDPADPQGVIQHFTSDPLDPFHFWVYPQAPSTITSYARLLYSRTPAPIPLPDDPLAPYAPLLDQISVLDIHIEPLEEYTLYDLKQSDDDSEVQAQAKDHLAAFQAMMGIKEKVDIEGDPANRTNAYGDRSPKPVALTS